MAKTEVLTGVILGLLKNYRRKGFWSDRCHCSSNTNVCIFFFGKFQEF